MAGLGGQQRVGVDERAQVEPPLPLRDAGDRFEQVDPADQGFQCGHAECGQPLPGLAGEQAEEADHPFHRAPVVVPAQVLALGGDAGGAVVQVADAQVLAAERHHGRGAETEALRAEHGRLDHVQPGLEAAVGLQADLVAQVVGLQGLVHLGQAQLPGRTGVADGRDRAGGGAAVIAAHRDQVGIGLGHAGGNGADARPRHQLDRHQRLRVHLLEVEDELGQILDGVDVVVRRRRDQGHAGHGEAQPGDQFVHLAARQLAALARLGALGDLDLQHLGVDQVGRGDAEPARGDLLDLRHPRGTVAGRVLAALAAVRAAAQAVHGLGQGLVRLGRERAQGHGGGVEAAEDRSLGLDLVERDRLDARAQAEQVAQGGRRPVVDERGAGPPLGGIAACHRGLQAEHHLRVEGVVLLAVHVLEQAARLDRQLRPGGRAGKGPLVRLQVGKGGAADAARRAREADLHHLPVQADDLEQLRPPVRGHGGDAHLAEDLQQPLLDALAVVLQGLVRGQVEGARPAQVGEHGVAQVGVDGGGAEADQAGHLVRVAGRGRGHDQVGVAAQPLTAEVVVDRAHGQQGVYGQLRRGAVLVGEEQQHRAGADRGGRLAAEGFYGRAQVGLLRVVAERQPVYAVAPAIQVEQGPVFFRGQHRRGEDHPVRVLFGLGEDRLLLRADGGLQGHDHRLAQRVDGRVGHLGELLAEPVVERALLPGEHGHGGVVAHGADRLLAGLGQRPEQLVALLQAHLVHLHGHGKRLALQLAGGPVLAEGALEPQGVVLEPLLVGVTALEVVIHLGGVAQGAGFRIHGEQLPRAEPPLGHHLARVQGTDTDLRGDGEQVVAAEHPARRPQTVAVERADRKAAVGEHQPGRPVPGLGVHGVELVEGAQVRVQVLDVLPGGRDEHADGPVQVHAAGHQHLEHVVQAGRVRAGAVDQRGDGLDVGQQRRAELAGARLGPVAVAGDGVDLAVVGEQAEGLGERPARHGVGGEALVEQADGAGQVRVGQVREEAGQVHGHHQSLVDHRARAQAGDIRVRIAFEPLLRPPPGDEQPGGELRLVEIRGVDKDLGKLRQAGQGDGPEAGGGGGHRSPAGRLQAHGREFLVQGAPGRRGPLLIPAEHEHAHPVERGQLPGPAGLRGPAQEQVRLLQEQAAAVAGAAVGGDAAPVGHARQGLDGGAHQAVAGLAMEVGNEPEAAVVPVVVLVVEPVRHRCTWEGRNGACS